MSLGSGWKLRSLVPIMVSGASCGGEANVSDAQTATPAIERCYGTFSTGCRAQTFSDSPVDPLPSTVDAPSSEVIVDSLYANGKKVGEGLPVRLGRRNGSRPPRR